MATQTEHFINTDPQIIKKLRHLAGQRTDIPKSDFETVAEAKAQAQGDGLKPHTRPEAMTAAQQRGRSKIENPASSGDTVMLDRQKIHDRWIANFASSHQRPPAPGGRKA